MQISLEAKSVAQDFRGIQNLILRVCSTSCDPGTEKDSLRHMRLVQLHEELCKFLRLECGAAKITSGAERTVITIPFTGGREQRLQQFDLFSIGKLSRLDKDRALFLG